MSMGFNKLAGLLFLMGMHLPFAAHADMAALSDADMATVNGQGIGMVMDNFVFSHGHDPANNKTFRITGITDTNGNPVTINVNQLYIARAGSNYGADLNPVNLGRLTNPYEMDLVNGDAIGLPGEAVLQFSAPTKVAAGTGYDCLDAAATLGSGDCSSRPGAAGWENGERPDLGLEMELQVGLNAPRNLNFHATSAVFDGSYLRLWGDGDNDKMAAEFKLNFYTPELEISTCTQASQGCSSSIKMRDFEMELALGHTFQPLYLGADPVTGGMTIEIARITHEYINNINAAGQSDGSAQGDAAFAFFQDFYSNPDYKSSIRVGEMDVGGVNLGSSRIEGIQIQYLNARFRDLEP